MKNQVQLMRFALITFTLSCFLFPAQVVFAQWSTPKELQKQVDALSDEQAEFLTSGAVLKFMPELQLEHELSIRNAESLTTLVNDLMTLSDEMSYDPERDMGATPQYSFQTIQRGHTAHTCAAAQNGT